MNGANIVTLVCGVLVFLAAVYAARPAKITQQKRIEFENRLAQFGERLERFGTRMDTYSDNQDAIRDDVRKLHNCLDDVQQDVKKILSKLEQPMTITATATLDTPAKG